MEQLSIGLIGGADGPTAVFVTGDPLSLLPAAGVLLLLAVLLLRHLRKKK